MSTDADWVARGYARDALKHASANAVTLTGPDPPRADVARPGAEEREAGFMGEMEDRCARLEATLRHIQVVLLITWVASMGIVLLVWMSLSRQIAALRP